MAVLGLAMICKDEQDGIRACLESLRPHIGYYVVSDTGSTDSTMEIIREVLDGIPGVLRQDEWVDFGHNRSIVLAEIAGRCDWVVASDADMVWEFDEGWGAPQGADALMVQMGTEDFAYRLPLVIRGDVAWKSVGAVHEYTTRVDGQMYVGQPTDAVRVACHGNRSSREKSLWHARMLEDELRREPVNARDVFYLAQTYRDLGDPRAIALYERRSKMGGYEEERWYAQYRHALLLPTWPAQVMALIAAWEARPQRLEPAYELAKGLNWRGQHHAALGFARTPVHPSTDSLFVHTSVWRWGMDFERSIAEWHAGDRDESRRLGERLLTIDIPQNVRDAVERNLTFC